MLERPPTQDVDAVSAIPEGYILVGNRGFRLDIYNGPNLGARFLTNEGLTARMAILNLERFSGETG